jgi:hypothetical protein
LRGPANSPPEAGSIRHPRPIEPDYDEGLAGADLAQQARQHGAAAIGAGGVLLENRVATGIAQFVALRIGPLLLGGDPRIADQTAWSDGFASCCLYDEIGPPEPAFLHEPENSERLAAASRAQQTGLCGTPIEAVLSGHFFRFKAVDFSGARRKNSSAWRLKPCSFAAMERKCRVT